VSHPRRIRSAEQAVSLYLYATERTSAIPSTRIAERVRRPRVLACPRCGCRAWQEDRRGRLVCVVQGCRQVWPSGRVGRAPAEEMLELRVQLGRVLATTRLSPEEPPPLSPWMRRILFAYAGLTGTGGRLAVLVAQLQHRYPKARYAPWRRAVVQHLLRAAERRTEARLQYAHLAEGE
jgi:hypothetical protein